MLIVFSVVLSLSLSRYFVNSFLKMSIYSLIQHVQIAHLQLPTLGLGATVMGRINMLFSLLE